MHCGASLTATEVISLLGELIAEHGRPACIRSDNGPELSFRSAGHQIESPAFRRAPEAPEIDLWPVGRSSAIHHGVGLIGPFVEGSGVAACPVVTEDFQDKRCETRACTASSVGSDRGLR